MDVMDKETAIKLAMIAIVPYVDLETYQKMVESLKTVFENYKGT